MFLALHDPIRYSYSPAEHDRLPSNLAIRAALSPSTRTPPANRNSRARLDAATATRRTYPPARHTRLRATARPRTRSVTGDAAYSRLGADPPCPPRPYGSGQRAARNAPKDLLYVVSRTMPTDGSVLTPQRIHSHVSAASRSAFPWVLILLVSCRWRVHGPVSIFR